MRINGCREQDFIERRWTALSKAIERQLDYIASIIRNVVNKTPGAATLPPMHEVVHGRALEASHSHVLPGPMLENTHSGVRLGYPDVSEEAAAMDAAGSFYEGGLVPYSVDVRVVDGTGTIPQHPVMYAMDRGPYAPPMGYYAAPGQPMAYGMAASPMLPAGYHPLPAAGGLVPPQPVYYPYGGYPGGLPPVHDTHDRRVRSSNRQRSSARKKDRSPAPHRYHVDPYETPVQQWNEEMRQEKRSAPQSARNFVVPKNALLSKSMSQGPLHAPAPVSADASRSRPPDGAVSMDESPSVRQGQTNRIRSAPPKAAHTQAHTGRAIDSYEPVDRERVVEEGKGGGVPIGEDDASAHVRFNTAAAEEDIVNSEPMYSNPYNDPPEGSSGGGRPKSARGKSPKSSDVVYK